MGGGSRGGEASPLEQARDSKPVERRTRGPESPRPADTARAQAGATSPAAVPRERDERTRLITGTDVGVAFGIAVLGGVAWCLSSARWRKLARAIAPTALPFAPSGDDGLAATIERVGGDALGQPVKRVMRELMANYVERVLPYLRDYRPGGWQPLVRVLGREHIDRALASGQGVVLWDSHFAFSSLVTKLGLRRAGLWISHLSHPRHGFSSSRFGMRVLNPVITRIERRYLGERVILGLDESADALNRLGRRLAAGGIVSVKVGGTAKRPLMAPFLEGRIPLGAGAPLLARQSGAVLLPVFTLRDAKGGFTIQIEPPLALPRDGGTGEALERAACDYAKRLEPYVLGAPGQWLGWSEL